MPALVPIPIQVAVELVVIEEEERPTRRLPKGVAMGECAHLADLPALAPLPLLQAQAREWVD